MRNSDNIATAYQYQLSVTETSSTVAMLQSVSSSLATAVRTESLLYSYQHNQPWPGPLIIALKRAV